KHPQDIVGCGASVGRLEIAEGVLGIGRASHAAARTDRNAAGLRHLLADQDLGATPCSFNRGKAATKSVSGDDNVKGFIEMAVVELHVIHIAILQEREGMCGGGD